MKKLLIAALLATAFAQAGAAVREADRIVAVVNKDVITEVGLRQRMAEAQAMLKKQNVPLPPAEVLRSQVFEQMVTESVQLQYAEQTGLRLDDAELERTLTRIAESNKLSPEAFRERLKREGTDLAQFREQVRREVMLDRLREREVDNKVVVTDAEADLFMKSAVNANRSEYHLAHILVSLPEQATPQVLEGRARRAEEALQKVRAGGNFAQLAASYSDARDAMSGGELGWRPASQLPAEFVRELDQLKAGGVTPILRSASGLHIFKLLDKRSGGQSHVIEQIQARHILIKTNEAISEADAKRRILQIRDRLQSGMKFEEAARLYSEDASANRGGDLGWLAQGDTVPEFERVMLALKPGVLSEPVRSPFGWHLIEVTGRRNQDVGAERDVQAVKREIRARKAEQQYQDWIRQLRDSAHVENYLNEQ
jgi:peptidyl-prolyl cis-trans isomerase SurA